MLTATIQLTGSTREDLLLALDEVAAKIGDDYTTGSDRNETGSYTFEVDGSEQEPSDA